MTCPSLTGISTISPATSGEILTSTSGWIFPVAVTSWMMVFRTAFSVVIGIGLTRCRETTMALAAMTIRTAAAIRKISFFFDRFAFGVLNSLIGFLGSSVVPEREIRAQRRWNGNRTKA